MLFAHKATETSAGNARRPRVARRPAATTLDLKSVLPSGETCCCDEFIEYERGDSQIKTDGLLEEWQVSVREVCHGVQQSVEANMPRLCSLIFYVQSLRSSSLY